jgi:calcium-dependent protein kinase
MKLQEAALTFIVSQLTTKKEQEELMNTFKTFDKNGNGTISKDELYEGYKEIYGNKMTPDELQAEVDEIMEKLDIDKSG